jgi:hypothetical protein
MKKPAWIGDNGVVTISCGPFKAVRATPHLKWHRITIWRLNIWRSPKTGKLLLWKWM